MTDSHPITPSLEMVREWFNEAYKDASDWQCKVVVVAAQWGADQELEACCEWLTENQVLLPDGFYLPQLRAARRPKPPSLKQQGLEALKRQEANTWCEEINADFEIIRRALENIPDA